MVATLDMPTGWRYERDAKCPSVWFPVQLSWVAREGEIVRDGVFRWIESGEEYLAAVDSRGRFMCFLCPPPWKHESHGIMSFEMSSATTCRITSATRLHARSDRTGL